MADSPRPTLAKTTKVVPDAASEAPIDAPESVGPGADAARPIRARSSDEFARLAARLPMVQRVQLIRHVQQARGNAVAARLVTQFHQAPPRELLRARTIVPSPVVAVQRDSARAAPAAGETAPADLAAKIRSHVRTRGGITVAVHPVASVHASSEFKRQAGQFAIDHQALGLRSGSLRAGVAMELSDSLPAVLQRLTDQIQALLSSNPDPDGGQSMDVSIQTLAIFTHGERNQIEAGPHGQWIKNSLAPWVDQIAPFLSPSPLVLLYACSTAGQPPKGLPFAEAMRERLQTDLESRYGLDAGVSPQVWGHQVSGHTTANMTLTSFGGGPDSSAGTSLVPVLARRMTALAVEQAGRTDDLTDAQRRQAETRGRYAIVQIFQTSSAETGATNPLNDYLREIPQMGIDRVWIDLSTPATPDLSDLDLTPDAVARVSRGLAELQDRFGRQLDHLQRWIASLPHSR